ncbi:ABC transporter permease [Shinella yambaruensis]|uniref:ABC transporter permease n=1 Tax=Shinella yambaruensis TaxID=415996 RepID=A0ABQ5ZJI8_9HYPH|nr:ABC transporter permease [Shinella yambaruensis]MCJ8024799.1 ABC transporter permease [Shinella yambaruensis]MCU7979252.1 ABC transporter permease [Shinella yambaruensis]GLR51078.1 ABC transporter permease [Shinella yambaruensis]
MLNTPATSTQVTHGQRLWLYATVALVMTFLVIPCILVIPMSFSDSQYLEFPPRSLSLRWYEAFFTSPEWIQSAVVSLKVAGLTTVLATVLGTLASYGLYKATSLFTPITRGLLMLPMMIPLIFVAIGVFFVYARFGLNNTITGLVLAHTTLAIPFVMIAVGNGLKSFDPNLERAARSLGASPVTAFLTVTLPQIRISVFSGMLFAFVTSFDEVVVSLFVSSGANSTLTKRMFANIRDQVDPTVAAISSMLVALSIVVLIAAQFVKRKDA